MTRKRNLMTGIIRVALVVALVLCTVPAGAQCPRVNKAFAAGEHLTYDMYFNWKFVWIKCGTAHYTIKNATYDGKKMMRNDLLFLGNKQCNAIFTMKDTLLCYFTPDLVPVYYRKGATEGSSYTCDQVWYSFPSQTGTHLKQLRTNREGEVKDYSMDVAGCVYDMLSTMLVARSYDASKFKAGQKLTFPVTTGRHVEDMTLVYNGKKNWKANDGVTYRCLDFSLIDWEDKKKNKELLRFYITDDDNHLPVRIDFFLKFGCAKGFFVKGEGIRHPMTSVVRKTDKKS